MTDNDHHKTDRIKIGEHITITGITNSLLGSPTRGWVFTEGLDAFGWPELEIRDVHLFMLPIAAHLLNAVADHLVNSGDRVEVGNTISLQQFGAGTVQLAKLEPIPGNGDNKPVQRWTLVDPPEMQGRCDNPNCTSHHTH